MGKLVEGYEVSEGAGVNIVRYAGTPALDNVDPVLMLDEFKSDDPEDYIAGFPSHPHRGFETITYMLHGKMRHIDSTGRESVLESGGIQRMTAGRGLVHSEMPEMEKGLMWGYQVWVNLPSANKMMQPSYEDTPSDKIPRVVMEYGQVKVICGEFEGQAGPVRIVVPFDFLDVELKGLFNYHRNYQGLIRVLDGTVVVNGTALGWGNNIYQFDVGEKLEITSESGGRFILLAGEPIGESIVRGGPFVMNTREEISKAYLDFREGRF